MSEATKIEDGYYFTKHIDSLRLTRGSFEFEYRPASGAARGLYTDALIVGDLDRLTRLGAEIIARSLKSWNLQITPANKLTFDPASGTPLVIEKGEIEKLPSEIYQILINHVLGYADSPEEAADLKN